jgi:hypothetical protein
MPNMHGAKHAGMLQWVEDTKVPSRKMPGKCARGWFRAPLKIVAINNFKK